MRVYKPRFKAPEPGNPFYNTKQYGGYSQAIKGKPESQNNDTLSNCVGYAYGRFHEIAGDTSMRLLCPVNAELFIDFMSPDLTIGQEPKLGACAVWQKGNTKTAADGAGHVAIVEQINEDTSIITSESAWETLPEFFTKERKNDGNWGQPAEYKFLGFIYQPDDYLPAPEKHTLTFTIEDVRMGTSGGSTLQVQTILKGLGLYSGLLDGECGSKTFTAIKRYQRLHGLYVDGWWGPKCWFDFMRI